MPPDAADELPKRALTDKMIVLDAERPEQAGQLRRLDVRVLDDQPMDVPDQHERLRQPGEIGHLFGAPVRGGDHVHGGASGGGGAGRAGRAAGAVHHVPGDLPGDAHQQLLGHVRVLVDDHLGQGHGHQLLGRRVHAQRLLALLALLLLRPRAGRLVLHEHHEHGAHGQRPQDAHLRGHGQNHSEPSSSSPPPRLPLIRVQRSQSEKRASSVNDPDNAVAYLG